MLAQAPMLLAHRVLGPFVEAYAVVADQLAGARPPLPVDEPAFLKECVGVGRQQLMQRRGRAPSRSPGSCLAARCAWRQPRPGRSGDGDVRARRSAFAAEMRDVVRRIRIIRRMAQPAIAGQEVSVGDLSELIDEIEAAPEGPRIAAFFDFDGTLIAGFSGNEFYRARRAGEIGPAELARTVLAVGDMRLRGADVSG